jgi:hypothetical protein
VALEQAWTAAGGEVHATVAPGAGHNLDPTNVDLAGIEAFLDRFTQ